MNLAIAPSDKQLYTLQQYKIMLIKMVGPQQQTLSSFSYHSLVNYLPISLQRNNTVKCFFFCWVQGSLKKEILIYIQCILILMVNIILLQNFKIIERMAEQQLSRWEQVTYSPLNKRIPLQRWGHKLISTNNGEIYMFGGFGGENSQGRYLNDLWKFDLSDYRWREIVTTGNAPQNRSNYSIHFNQKDNQLILFGGGSSSKIRFNSVCILHLDSMHWQKYMPNTAQQAPWERTYHCSEFHYPYLIVHGGEGVSCIDLDDSWVFNITNHTWKKLQFEQNKEIPSPRRFHCSALVDSKFYIFGGCKNNYELIGDMYRVDLKQLFSQGKTNGLLWQKVINNCSILERWGHSCDVHNNKLYIFAGRVNSTSDTNDLLVFDTKNSVLTKMDVSDKGTPKPRRRHSTVLVGNCLLSFGGYNGKYLNDFYFINLPKESIASQQNNIEVAYHKEEFISKIYCQQKNIGASDQLLTVRAIDGQQSRLPTNYYTILQNDFFKYVQRYVANQGIAIQLPSFCNLDMFRVIHLGILQNSLIVCKSHPLSYYLNLIQSAQYFNSSFLIKTIERYLLSQLTTSNCLEMLKLSITHGLPFLRGQSAEVYIKNNFILRNKIKDDLTSCESLSAKASDQNLIHHQQLPQSPLAKVIQQAYQLYKFQIQQKKMRINVPNFFIKTATKLKNIFSHSQQQSKVSNESQKSKKDSGVKKVGCLSKLISFFAKISLST